MAMVVTDRKVGSDKRKRAWTGVVATAMEESIRRKAAAGFGRNTGAVSPAAGGWHACRGARSPAEEGGGEPAVW